MGVSAFFMGGDPLMATGRVVNETPQVFHLSYSNNVTEVTNEYCYKCGHLVVADVAFKCSVTTAKRLDDYFTVPSGYRPRGHVFFNAFDNGADLAMNGDLKASGSTSIYRNHSTSLNSIRFHLEYLVK